MMIRATTASIVLDFNPSSCSDLDSTGPHCARQGPLRYTRLADPSASGGQALIVEHEQVKVCARLFG
jgi:hypothetical protein